MFRTPHMKTCVNQLRLVLTLRDTPIQRERPVCSRSALGRRLSRGEDVTHPHSCGLLSTPRTVLDASEWIPLCIRAQFLLTHMYFNWTQKPNAFLNFAHMSLNTSPSRCPSFPESRVKKSQNSPESSNKTQTCDCVYKRGTGRPLSLQWRSTMALQTRGLHTEAEQRPLVDGCLSAENEARCRGSLRPNAALYEREKSWAAVLVCLCAVSGRPALLFTLRSAKLKGRHKGDVSFAGGKKDASDRTVVDTALREAREELGIHVTEDRVWGVLKPLRDMSGMMIAPVIANLGPLEALSFRPNPSEVEEIFTLTLEHLCQPQNRGYTHFRTGDRYGYTLPVFHSPKHRVWGLTAVAMDHTLKLIVPPEQLLDQRLAQ